MTDQHLASFSDVVEESPVVRHVSRVDAAE